MARARKQNGMLDFLTKKRETYRRDVKGERADLIRQAKSEKARRAKVDREEKAEERAQERKEAMALRREELVEKKKQRKSPLSSFMGIRMYKTGSGEYMTSIDDSRFDSIRDAKEFVKSMRSNPRGRKRNPEAAAAELAEAFTGRPAKTATEFRKTIQYHSVLTGLAPLMQIKVWVDDRHVKAIDFDKEKSFLGSAESGEQLYVEGDHLDIDLTPFGITGHAATKDLIRIGDVYSVTYWTAKFHLGKADKTPGPYEHIFSEHGEEEPELIYDRLNQEPQFAGGEYHIPIDIDGRYSSGINN